MFWYELQYHSMPVQRNIFLILLQSNKEPQCMVHISNRTVKPTEIPIYILKTQTSITFVFVALFSNGQLQLSNFNY